MRDDGSGLHAHIHVATAPYFAASADLCGLPHNTRHRSRRGGKEEEREQFLKEKDKSPSKGSVPGSLSFPHPSLDWTVISAAHYYLRHRRTPRLQAMVGLYR